MNRRFLGRSRSALLIAIGATCALPVTRIDAQGFGSVSSAPPPAVVQPAPASPPVVQPTPAVVQPAATPPPVVPAAPAAPAPFASASSPAPVAPVNPSAAAQLASINRPNGAFEQADKVLVDKSDRRLFLLKQDRVVAEYPIKLGLNPYGHKQKEGDFRTPEGKYTLSRRNPQSDFFLAIQVSYPNREDAAWARQNGNEPGGLIMIHGQPNVPKRSPQFYATRDWTDGCIALSNADMVDVWLRTTVGLPIEIRP